MPVEFLSDDEAAGYGRFPGVLTRPDLDRWFFLADDDRELVAGHRGDHNRLGYAVQLVTARFLGTFLTDLADVPRVVVDYLAVQLNVRDPSCLKRYGERSKTRLEHVWEIRRVLGLVEFGEARDELETWVRAAAWTTGDGPTALFVDAVAWLRTRNVVLPGVSVLARLVARVRDETTARLWDTLTGLLSEADCLGLDAMLVVRDGGRVCDLERLRKGPVTVSGPSMLKALDRISEIDALPCGVGLDVVPERRVVELARYGLAGKTGLLKRHPPARRHAILVASVRYLRRRATDDALELLDELVANELVGNAVRSADKGVIREHSRMTGAASSLATAVRVLLASADQPVRPTLEEVMTEIETVVSRGELTAAVVTIDELVPEPGEDEWRALLAARRIGTVSGFLRELTARIEFGADPEAALTSAAMKAIPVLLDRRGRLTVADIDLSVVTGNWKKLVLGSGGTIDKNAYVFCVLIGFHRHLKRRGIYTSRSALTGGSILLRSPRSTTRTRSSHCAARLLGFSQEWNSPKLCLRSWGGNHGSWKRSDHSRVAAAGSKVST